MNSKTAKKIRMLAEQLTAGMPIKETKKQYKRLKKLHKLVKVEL